MVGGGHYVLEEGLTRCVRAVGLLDGLLEEIAIAYAPSVGKAGFLFGEEVTVYHFKSVIAEEVVHVVEVAVATINELGVVPLLAKDRAQRKEVLVARTAYNA